MALTSDAMAFNPNKNFVMKVVIIYLLLSQSRPIVIRNLIFFVIMLESLPKRAVNLITINTPLFGNASG